MKCLVEKGTENDNEPHPKCDLTTAGPSSSLVQVKKKKQPTVSKEFNNQRHQQLTTILNKVSTARQERNNSIDLWNRKFNMKHKNFQVNFTEIVIVLYFMRPNSFSNNLQWNNSLNT